MSDREILEAIAVLAKKFRFGFKECLNMDMDDLDFFVKSEA